MKQLVFFPVYNIFSPLVKSSIGLNDNRSIEKFFSEAGIQVHEISGKKCILCQDLLTLGMPKQSVLKYEPESDMAKEIFDMFE